jgi:hypothetical protein
MKRQNTARTFAIALLLAGRLSGAHAASLISDGDFDRLPAGTAPDNSQPAGPWSFPRDYFIAGTDFAAETSVSQFTIVPAPAGGTGNALRVSFTSTENLGAGTYVPNLLARNITRESEEMIHASFDVYVLPGHGGGTAILSKGDIETADRASQLVWHPDGRLLTRNSSGADTTIIASCPRGVWQTARLQIDLTRQRYNLYWSEKGQPVSVTRTNLAFRSPSIPFVDRIAV